MKILCLVVGCFLCHVVVIGRYSSGICQTAAPGPNQASSANQRPLVRRYREGERLTYHMKAKNEAWSYEIEANGVVKKNSAGAFVEEYAWSHLMSNGAPAPLAAEGGEVRQSLSLDADAPPALPDFSRVPPILIGPMADFATFYADLWLAARGGSLAKAGDHAYVKIGGPNSWADGSRVVLGEDSIDFDMTLSKVSETDGTATLLVRHVPPQEPKIRLSAEWMRAPVANSPNNWVEVKKEDGKYIAEVGKETFDVEIKVSLTDGEILAATLDNPVTAIQRECTDAALANCGEAKPRQIRRQIEIQLVKR